MSEVRTPWKKKLRVHRNPDGSLLFEAKNRAAVNEAVKALGGPDLTRTARTRLMELLDQGLGLVTRGDRRAGKRFKRTGIKTFQAGNHLLHVYVSTGAMQFRGAVKPLVPKHITDKYPDRPQVLTESAWVGRAADVHGRPHVDWTRTLGRIEDLIALVPHVTLAGALARGETAAWTAFDPKTIKESWGRTAYDGLYAHLLAQLLKPAAEIARL